MSSAHMRPDLLERCMKILGISSKGPDLASLTGLVQAHLARIPFENISKLYYKKQLGLRGIPSLNLYLEGLERYHFGGTCYSNNYYFHLLLAALGYQVVLCGADMAEPDVHMVSMVTLGGHEYLVDVGYAAPFRVPLQRDLVGDTVLVEGRDRYVLKPQDARGCSLMELYREGVLKHGYLAKPVPKQISDFEQAMRASFRPEATFMNALLLARFDADRSIVIHNLSLIESHGTATSTRMLANRGELAQVIHQYFQMPVDLITDVVDDLGELGNAWN